LKGPSDFAITSPGEISGVIPREGVESRFSNFAELKDDVLRDPERGS